MYCYIISAIASASSSSKYSWSETFVPDDRYAVSNGSGYVVLIYWDEYVVLDRELDTLYPMEVDTPYSTVDQTSDAQDLYVRCEDAQDDQAFIGAYVSILRRERRYFCSMASSYEREAVIARQAWSYSKSRIQAMEAQIRALHRDVDRHVLKMDQRMLVVAVSIVSLLAIMYGLLSFYGLLLASRL
ncbi:hypothetical protein Tco_0022153 [Tanacetum coccineum]